MEDKRVYITRDKFTGMKPEAEVWPATIGIRKFHGCLQYGAAWQNRGAVSLLYPGNNRCRTEKLTRGKCMARYGFYPEPGEAWYVAENGKRTKIDIAFTG